MQRVMSYHGGLQLPGTSQSTAKCHEGTEPPSHMIHEPTVGAGKMVQRVRHSPHKSNDLSSDPHKWHMSVVQCTSTRRWGQRQENCQNCQFSVQLAWCMQQRTRKTWLKQARGEDHHSRSPYDLHMDACAHKPSHTPACTHEHTLAYTHIHT